MRRKIQKRQNKDKGNKKDKKKKKRQKREKEEEKEKKKRPTTQKDKKTKRQCPNSRTTFQKGASLNSVMSYYMSRPKPTSCHKVFVIY